MIYLEFAGTPQSFVKQYGHLFQKWKRSDGHRHVIAFEWPEAVVSLGAISEEESITINFIEFDVTPIYKAKELVAWRFTPHETVDRKKLARWAREKENANRRDEGLSPRSEGSSTSSGNS